MTVEAICSRYEDALAQAHADLEHGRVTSQDAMALKQVIRVGMTREEKAVLLLQCRQPAMLGLVIAAVLHERQQQGGSAA
ncbi:hypothetical protein LuPra_03949 [Luteitalea pratensis]|uniref:Uncharacterized protein n=1 Tax=Luteitalea pratensis TaxID=1855912 RepID=A0A143PRG8_LUTPR|nr:hypothetical protein LuPra_03949 [Luteitalea pratensis]